MPTFSNIDGEESATVTFTVGAVQLTRNSSAELQEILVIGDPEVASSLGLARVTASAPASTNAALNVRVVSGPSSLADFPVRVILPSTVTDNLVRAILPSTAADNLVRPIAPSTYGDGGVYRVAQSTAGDLNVTVAGYSTTANVSSVAGRVATMPNSTLWASSAGFHFDSSGALQIVAQNGGGVDYTHGSTFTLSSIAGPATILTANTLPTAVSTGQFVAGWGTLNGAQYVAMVTDSGATVMDSTNQAIKVNVVAGAAGGSTIVTVSALPLISSAVPAAGSSGLTVWLAGGNVSSLSTGHITVDTGSIRVHQSTAADLNVTVAGYSTTVNVSSGVIRAQAYTSSGGGVDGSTDIPAQGVLGLHVRVAPSSIQTFAASTVGQTSTGTVLVSSQANPIKVYSFSVTSTVVAASTVSFRSSLAQVLLWPLVLGSGSSGITGANLASSPPNYLFRTAPNNALVFHTPSSGPEFHVAISYST